MKKAQISVYVIIGIIVLVAAGIFMFSLSSRQSKEILNQETFSDALDKQNVEAYVNLCLKESALKAIEVEGINSEQSLETDVLSSINNCVNKGFSSQMAISEKTPTLTAKISNESIVFSLEYPLKINDVISLKDFSYTYDLVSFLQTNSGLIKSGEILQSTDMKASLVFDQDTKATAQNSKYISLKVLDRGFDNLQNGVVISSVVYDAEPSGLVFDNPVKMAISVSDDDIKGIDTSRLSLAYYDEPSGVWVTVDSKYDPIKKEVFGEITHFTKYAVAICASPQQGKSLIPMDFVARDPFKTDKYDVEDPYMWNYDVKDGQTVDLNKIHLLPELMTEDLAKLTQAPANTPDVTYNIKDWAIADHDLDDQHGYQDPDGYKFYNFNTVSFKDSTGKDLSCPLPIGTSCGITDPSLRARYASIKTTLDSGNKLTDQNALTPDEKNKCLKSCSDYAKTILERTYPWLSSNAGLINKDGIRDFSDINCAFTAPQAGSTFTVSCDTLNYDMLDEQQQFNSKVTASLEWIKVKDDKLVTTFQEEGKKKFFATPNTIGFSVSADKFPVQFINNIADVTKIDDYLKNAVYSVTGSLKFDVAKGGSACVNSEVAAGENKYSAVVAYLITDKTTYAASYDCLTDDLYNRQCSAAKPADNTFILNSYRICKNAGEQCYEQERHDNRLTDKKLPLGGYSDSQDNVKYNPIIAPGVITGPTVGRLFPNTQKGNSVSVASLIGMDYYALIEDPSVEKNYDWSCSDMCIWTLNKGTGSGLLKAGENTVTADVLNIKDPTLYAKGYLELQGNGVFGLDQCGATVQNRINYLCGCNFDFNGGKCNSASMSPKDLDELNCLESLRQDLNTYYQSNELGHQMDLCDITNMIKVVQNTQGDKSLAGCRYTDPADPRYGQIKGQVIQELTAQGVGNGGVCVGDTKYCRDNLDPLTDNLCNCGGDIYNGNADIKYCCKDGDPGKKLLKEAPADPGQCRGTTVRDSCTIPGTTDQKVYLNRYLPYNNKCWTCNAAGFAEETDVSNCPDITVKNACKFTTLYGKEVFMTPGQNGCYAMKEAGDPNYNVYSVSCEADVSDSGHLQGTLCAPLTFSECPMDSSGNFACCKDSACKAYSLPLPPDSCTATDINGYSFTMNNFEQHFALPPLADKSQWGCYLCKQGSLNKLEDYKCFQETSSVDSGTLPDKNICESQTLGGPVYLNDVSPKCAYIPDYGEVIYGICKNVNGNMKTYGKSCGTTCTASNVGDCCDDKGGCIDNSNVGPQGYGAQCADSTGKYFSDVTCPINQAFCCQASDNNYYCGSSSCSAPIGEASPKCPVAASDILTFNSIKTDKKCICNGNVVDIPANTDYSQSDCAAAQADCQYTDSSNSAITIKNGDYALDSGAGIVKCTNGATSTIYSKGQFCFARGTQFSTTDITNVVSKSTEVKENVNTYICVGGSDSSAWALKLSLCADPGLSVEDANYYKNIGDFNKAGDKVCMGSDNWMNINPNLVNGVCDKLQCICGGQTVHFGDYCQNGVPTTVNSQVIQLGDSCVNSGGCKCRDLTISQGMICMDSCAWGCITGSCQGNSKYFSGSKLDAYNAVYWYYPLMIPSIIVSRSACYPDNTGRTQINTGDVCKYALGCTCNGNNLEFSEMCT